MSRSQKKIAPSLKPGLLLERYPRLRIVATLLSILSAVVYFATGEVRERQIGFIPGGREPIVH
jgi:hypothetical protein